ncbi:glycoside hydrolase family 16 protein [Pedobacter sp. Du54]|uniref:glycoside hydrolase family 16 protein n=1 Tax=Pedobacter anseongensis TaxID=3133439 RepID=UPI0030B2AE61
MLILKKGIFYFLIPLLLLFSCKRELITFPMPQPSLDSALLSLKIFPVNNSITFSGYKWNVTNSPSKRAAPGNNYWSENSIWVDGKGYLHLKLTKETGTNKWFCAQISSEKKFGNGLYEFWVEGRLDQLDKNVVFGMFNYSGIDYYDEMDIEFSRWGEINNQNLHYNVYPEENTNSARWGSSTEFLLTEPYSIHRITRANSSVKFESYSDFLGRKIHSQLYSASTISKKEMPIYINLWAFKNVAPSDQKQVEIIIQKFVFTE